VWGSALWERGSGFVVGKRWEVGGVGGGDGGVVEGMEEGCAGGVRRWKGGSALSLGGHVGSQVLALVFNGISGR